MQIKFNSYGRDVVCDVSFTHYPYDNSVAILLEEGSEPYGVATTCLENSNLDSNQVIIDINNASYAIEALIEVKIIKSVPIRYIQSGYVSYPVYELTEKALNIINNQFCNN